MRIALPPPPAASAVPLRLLRWESGIPTASQAASHCKRAEMPQRTWIRIDCNQTLLITFDSFRANVQIAVNSSFAFHPPSTFSASVAVPASLRCIPPMSSSFAFSCASSSASALFPGRSAACGPDGTVHAASVSTPSGSSLASNIFPLPDFSHHFKSGESGAPVLVSGAAAAAFTGPLNAAIISRSVSPSAAVTCPPAPCCAAADCAAAPAMLLHPVAVELQVISSDFQISYGIDRCSARHAYDERIPLPDARSVPMSNPDDSPSLSSSRSVALIRKCSGRTAKEQSHFGSAFASARMSSESAVTWKQPLHSQLQTRPLVNEDWVPQPCSSSRHFKTDAVATAVLLCLSFIANVSAAQLVECPGVFSRLPINLVLAAAIGLSAADRAHMRMRLRGVLLSRAFALFMRPSSFILALFIMNSALGVKGLPDVITHQAHSCCARLIILIAASFVCYFQRRDGAVLGKEYIWRSNVVLAT